MVEHNEKWAKKQKERAQENNKLMKVEIPKKTPGGSIDSRLWYIIYEDNLLKPKILNKSFKSIVFARQYAVGNLSKHRYNILQGSVLLDYGYERAYRNLKSLTGKSSKTAGILYSFPQELPAQRRKTLRTMYRRNMRRLLLKLMNHGK